MKKKKKIMNGERRWRREESRKKRRETKESVGEFEIVIPGVSRKGEVRNERTDVFLSTCTSEQMELG